MKIRILGAGLALASLLLAGAAQAKSVLFVLDASGSMWGRVGSEAKIDVARRVLGGLVHDLPADVSVGLEAYGHTRKDDCNDIETLAPVGSARSEVVGVVERITPRGMTPLTEAIRKASETLKTEEGASHIVVVSDGRETCGGDPCAAAAAARKAGHDLRVHVVGFDVDEEEAGELQCIAKGGGGRYFGARNADELVDASAEVKKTVAAPAPRPKPQPRPEPTPEPAPEPVAAPEPPPEPTSEVVFRDDFDGEDLDPSWEILNPNPDATIVEEGELLAINSTVGSLAEDTAENLFRLQDDMPKGDWTATARISIDFQTGREYVYFGLHEDGENHLMNWLSTDGGSCYSGGSYSWHLYATPGKRSKGKSTSKKQEIWRVGRCEGDDNGLAARMRKAQPILMRLTKTGRSYVFSIKLEGTEDPKWIELDKLTLLKSKGRLAIGATQYQAGSGETTLEVDWVEVERNS